MGGAGGVAEPLGWAVGNPDDHRRFLAHFLSVEAPLRAYLLAATGRIHEAEDLYQQISAALWRNFAQYDPSRPFRAWAVGMARLEVLKWRQGLARSRAVLAPEAIEALEASAARDTDELGNLAEHLGPCLEALPRLAREVLRMRYAEDVSISEIARRIGKEVGAVEMMLVRLRRRLRQAVARRAGSTSFRAL